MNEIAGRLATRSPGSAVTTAVHPLKGALVCRRGSITIELVPGQPHPPAPQPTAPAEPLAELDLAALVAPLLGRTFELRRAYEQKQRLLTDLQHEIDILRLSTTPFPRRRQGIDNLEHHFRELAKAADDAAELLKAIRAEFDAVHQEAHEVEKQQRER